MRVLMIALAVFFFTDYALGQRGKPDDADQDRQMANPITPRQILELPSRDKAPEMSLPRALKIAETFIRKQKISISSCYLFEARLISEQTSKKSRWVFW